MQKRIVQFVIALRNSGVRVSLAESVDAMKAVENLGVENRDTFRTSLRTTLIKESTDLPTFDKLFDLFFQSDEPPRMFDTSQDMSQDEAQMIADAMRQFTDQLRKMLEKLLEGRPLTKEELERLAQQFNLDQMNDMRYQKWVANRMEQAMRFREVQEAMKEMMQMLQEMGMDAEHLQQLEQMMQANQQALQQQIEQYVGQRIAENMSKEDQRARADSLYNRPFEQLTEEDMQILRQEVRRLAAALRTRLALRLKRARTGHLDVKGTLRAKLKNGNVPIELKHRDRIQKPKIVVLCDLSTSMRHMSELMLSFLYSIQDQVSKTHAFAFIDHLEYISEFFNSKQPQQAVTDILQRMPSGHYNTDLGFSLDNFASDFMDTVDHRTTFIVVGDGRNNFNDPSLEIFRRIARRSRHTIWLNPEEMSMWGRGDSDMLKYAPLCGKVFQVGNLTQLADAVDHMLLGGV